eukprot:GHUV01025701.1.p1 GENE.GHUV01025701.1~~GHUV01025701.1.p1  ORF type:complete len:104 (+),score=15.58 GHUV01025701.1:42-353(+)
MERAVKEHMARFHGMDLAVLNAGIGKRGDFLDPNMTTEALEQTLDSTVDLRAVTMGVRYAAQAMMTAGVGGRISSIASAAGITAVSQQQRQLCPMMPALRGWA